MNIEKSKLKNIIEAALMAVAKPMTIEQLMVLFGDDERPSNSTMKECLAELQSDSEGRGVELKLVASGYRYQAKQEYSDWLSRLWEERPAKYSRAALETLALIAYRQPVTRAEIEDVRGVGVSSSIIKTMIEREWIRVVGHRDVPGRPALYATTKGFLDYFNMQSLEELPSLAEIKDLEDLNPELDLPDPDEEREVKVSEGDEASSNEAEGSSDGAEGSLDEAEGSSDGAEGSSDGADGSSEHVDDTLEETDAHLQTEAFSELDDLHTEAIADSFYEQSQGQTEESEFDSSEQISDNESNTQDSELDSSVELKGESGIVESYIDDAVETAPEVDNEEADSKEQLDVTAS